METPAFNWRFVLYRLYDIYGCLLYVGRTNDIRGRFYQHSQVQPWWFEVAHATVEFLPDLATLIIAERSTIHAENPRYNVVRTTPVDVVAHKKRKLKEPKKPPRVIKQIDNRIPDYAREAIDEIGRVHDRAVAVIDKIAENDPVRAFHLMSDLMAQMQRYATQAAGLRALAALEIKESEGLSFKELAIRLGMSPTRAHQLVKAGEMYRNSEQREDVTDAG